MRKNRIKSLGVIFLFATVSISQTIRPSQPTHLMYTPTPNVNPAYHLVLGLHEISFALPGKLQLQMSLLDNIGRINFGAKYGFLSNMAVGAGMAYNFIHIGDGSHGIWDKPRWCVSCHWIDWKPKNFSLISPLILRLVNTSRSALI